MPTDRRTVLILLDRLDGIVLVEMPHRATICFKDSKASPLEIVATFDDDQWWNILNDWRSFSADGSEPSKKTYRGIVHQRGSEKYDSADERDVLLDLKEIRAIV